MSDADALGSEDCSARSDPSRGQRIADAMAEVGTVGQDSKNQHEGFSYASKGAFFLALRGILAKNGLRVRMRTVSSSYELTETKTRGGVPYYMLTLEIEFALAAPLDGANADLEWDRRTYHHMCANIRNEQAAYSYAEKYWLEGTMLIDTGHPDEDIDGQAVPDYQNKPKPQQPKPSRRSKSRQRVAAGVITEAQVRRLWAIARGAGRTDSEVATFLSAHGVESSMDIQRKDYDGIIEKIEGSGPLVEPDVADREPGQEG